MNRRLCLIFAAGVCLTLAGVGKGLSAEKATFCADWTLYGKHTPYIVARDKGFFKEEGIDITIHRGHGSGDTVKRVGSQGCTYGMASTGPQAFGLNKGLPIRIIGILEHKFQETLYYFKEAGIRSPKDLEGKRVTPGPKASADYLMFPVFAKANKVNEAKIQWIFMRPPGKVGALGAGRVDAVIDFHTQFPRYQKAAKQAGKTLVAQLWADHGMDLYSAALFTHTGNLSGAKRGLTRGVVKAVYRGIAWTLENPNEAINIFVKSFPEQSAESVRGTLVIFMEHLFDGLSEKQGIGHADPAKFERTIRVTLESAKQAVKVKIKDAYTNEYVDALPKSVRFAKPAK